MGSASAEHRLPCPECDKGPKDGCLISRAPGRWFCGLVVLALPCERRHARQWRIDHARRIASEGAPDPQDRARQLSALAACRAIWKQTQPIAGTLSERSVGLRHCALPPADGDLRFHAALFCPEVDAEDQALVAKVTTVTGNKAIGIHGSRCSRAKRRRSRKCGSAAAISRSAFGYGQTMRSSSGSALPKASRRRLRPRISFAQAYVVDDRRRANDEVSRSARH